MHAPNACMEGSGRVARCVRRSLVRFDAGLCCNDDKRGHVDHGPQLCPSAFVIGCDRRARHSLVATVEARQFDQLSTVTITTKGADFRDQGGHRDPAKTRERAQVRGFRNGLQEPLQLVGHGVELVPMKSRRATNRTTSRIPASCPCGAATVVQAFSHTCSTLKRHIRRPRRWCWTARMKSPFVRAAIWGGAKPAGVQRDIRAL